MNSSECTVWSGLSLHNFSAMTSSLRPEEVMPLSSLSPRRIALSRLGSPAAQTVALRSHCGHSRVQSWRLDSWHRQNLASGLLYRWLRPCAEITHWDWSVFRHHSKIGWNGLPRIDVSAGNRHHWTRSSSENRRLWLHSLLFGESSPCGFQTTLSGWNHRHHAPFNPSYDRKHRSLKGYFYAALPHSISGFSWSIQSSFWFLFGRLNFVSNASDLKPPTE